MTEPKPVAFSKIAQELIGDFRGIPFKEPRRQVRRATQPVGPLLEDLLAKYRIGRTSPEDTIREQWADIVGPANAHYSHAGLIDARGRLTVLATHAVVRNELFHHRQGILGRIRALPGCQHVHELHIRAG